MPPPPIGPRFNLTALVRALMLERELRAQFNRNPEHIIKDFGLDDDERRILYTMDENVLSDYLFAPTDTQVGNFNIPSGEFHPAGPNCIADPGVTNPSYPAPTPELFRVRPRRLTSHDIMEVVNNGVTTKFFEISVFGQSFSRDPSPDIEIKHQGTNAVLPVDSAHLFGTMRCSQLTLLVRVQGVAAELGMYDIRLTNNPGTNLPYPIYNPLTLELAA